MRRLLIVPITVAVLAVGGCGGDDSTDAASTPAASTPSTAAPSTAAPAEGGEATEVGMRGLQFEPKDITVKVGTTVTFKNNEDIPHNVVAQEGADFASDTFGKDGTFEYVADKAGAIRYVCTIHPGMEGTLSVEE